MSFAADFATAPVCGQLDSFQTSGSSPGTIQQSIDTTASKKGRSVICNRCKKEIPLKDGDTAPPSGFISGPCRHCARKARTPKQKIHLRRHPIRRFHEKPPTENALVKTLTDWRLGSAQEDLDQATRITMSFIHKRSKKLYLREPGVSPHRAMWRFVEARIVELLRPYEGQSREQLAEPEVIKVLMGLANAIYNDLKNEVEKQRNAKHQQVPTGHDDENEESSNLGYLDKTRKLKSLTLIHDAKVSREDLRGILDEMVPEPRQEEVPLRTLNAVIDLHPNAFEADNPRPLVIASIAKAYDVKTRQARNLHAELKARSWSNLKKGGVMSDIFQKLRHSDQEVGRRKNCGGSDEQFEATA